MKIVILDGYTANPGDLSWKALEEMGALTNKWIARAFFGMRF